MLENQGLLLPGAVVIADNVLKPGAPLFLWRLLKSAAYDAHIVQVEEFGMPAEDWMSITVRRSELQRLQFLEGAPESLIVPKAPGELVQLEWECDQMRAQAMRTPGVS